MSERVAIIGLGLIGGSIGLALKAGEPGEIRIAGIARTHETAARAKKIGAIDEEARTPEQAVRGARLVIVASPIMTLPEVFREIAPALENGAVVTDAASVKAMAARSAREHLPAHAHFVGGHPMAGKETSGIDAAEAGLFKGKPWAIAPSVDAPERAVNTVVALATICGARPIFVDAEEHDSYVAAVSHVPLVAASALFSMAFGSTAWPELAGLASSGFRDTTRLASSSPEMAHDIMMTNRQNVVHWIDRLQQELSRYRAAIESGDDKLVAETFLRPQLERDNFVIAGPPRRDSGAPEAPRIGFADLMMGTKLADMMRKQEDMIRNAERRAEGKR